MLRYFSRRIPGLLAILLILLWVIIAVLPHVPGDPVAEKVGNSDLYFLNKDSVGYARYIQSYKKEASNYFIDVPAFFITIKPAFYPDSLHSVFPLSLRKSSKELAAKTQNKELVNRTIIALQRFAFLESDSLSMNIRKMSYAWLQNQISAEQLKLQVIEFKDESQHPEWIQFTAYFLSEYDVKPNRSFFPSINWSFDCALKQLFVGSSSGAAWFKGELGKSLMDGRPISKHLSDHIWPTLRLAIFSLIIALTLGTGLGFLLARKNWKWADVVLTFIYSIPLFALATILVSIIANMGEGSWIEIYGEETFEGDFTDIDSFFRYLTLPAFLMALPLSIFIATNVRDRLKEQYSREYVRSARSLGIPEKNILINHVWPNVKPYYLGFIGLLVPDLISGSVILEYIFARNGMGQYFLQATFYKDLPSLLFLICLFGVIQFIGNTFSDILISKADKRVKG